MKCLSHFTICNEMALFLDKSIRSLLMYNQTVYNFEKGKACTNAFRISSSGSANMFKDPTRFMKLLDAHKIVHIYSLTSATFTLLNLSGPSSGMRL